MKELLKRKMLNYTVLTHINKKPVYPPVLPGSFVEKRESAVVAVIPAELPFSLVERGVVGEGGRH